MPRQQHLLRVTLPIPPSINEQYATVNGHRVSTAIARRFKQQVKQKLAALEREGIIDIGLREHLRQGYLALFLAFYFETPLKRDLDGGLKITQDAICEALGLNDNRIVTIHLVKYIDPLHPHLEVELEALDDWQFDEEYQVHRS
ncbi:MAG TPA: RusA family crossover junction endodeoxyribonuclease [Ktedonobacteraceae bacterium]|jgi:crossover junction endodeoxyribonuclease RusA|nr:RusA family crossover junction endodeoxyribonuclease [Ktedonobacteraceae bacterium]